MDLNDSSVRLWLDEAGSIMIKVVDDHGDPVELTASQARTLAARLMALAEELDCVDEG